MDNTLPLERQKMRIKRCGFIQKIFVIQERRLELTSPRMKGTYGNNIDKVSPYSLRSSTVVFAMFSTLVLQHTFFYFDHT